MVALLNWIGIKLIKSELRAVFLYCCIYCQSWPASVIQMGQATLAVWAALKKYSLSIVTDTLVDQDAQQGSVI